ncbi:hypothetical protein OHA74_52030 [Streptomyces phaeochromogenes]|uniref:hypothetical protein n=1 Tax=Streptomyces phaeochromogenes TaxID=1923 RepID=UPI002E2A591D|nr:hypothetical protein [Streptomyces phaeochromogenes]
MAPLKKRFTTALVGLSATAAIAGCSATGQNEPNTAEDAASSARASERTPTEPADSASASPAGDSTPSSSASRSGPYADGEYIVDGEYGERGSSIGVRLALEDGQITAVDVTPHATDETSRGLQQRFADAVPQLVVGRDIDDVRLDRVAGNSNTPNGFNDALEEIKDEAGR